MLAIAVSEKLDCDVYQAFVLLDGGGVDFGKLIRVEYPDIDGGNFCTYIENFYRHEASAIRQSAMELEKYVAEREQAFAIAVQKYFGVGFNGELLTGFVSMFNCNPRFIDDASFQVYYRADIQRRAAICFHEMLHFIFFRYCDERFADETKGLDKNRGPFWELSEIVNVILLNRVEFMTVTGQSEKLYYPKLRQRLIEITEIWSLSHNLDQFLKASITYIREVA